MFDPDRLPELKSLVREATRGDSGLLDEVMREVVVSAQAFGHDNPASQHQFDFSCRFRWRE